ncbi:MAG: hypothetical protein WCD79_20055 [Chthoniobacteraceae bacterium]
MKFKIVVFGLVMLSVFSLLNAQSSVASVPAADKAGGPKCTMFVDPACTTVYLGKVNLTVNPLVHRGKFYLGGYAIKVMPYTFKNEQGTLKMDISDEAFQKLTEGKAVEFTGKATNEKNGKQKVVTGKTAPSGNGCGVATFTIVTDHGLMVFNTPYHLE